MRATMMLRSAICLLLLFPCCREKKSDHEEGLRKKNKVNNVAVEARFIDQGNRNDSTSTGNGYLYFTIRFDKPGFDPDPKTIEYLNFKMQDDFTMVNEKDTLMPSIAHRVVNGINGSYEFMIAFAERETVNGNGFLYIIYQDKVFGIGKQVFSFRKEDIQRQLR